jgi:phosphatidylserine synthase
MVSTIRFRSFKTIDLQMRRSYTVLFLIAAVMVAVATHIRIALAVTAYAYLASAFIGMAMTRFRHRGGTPKPEFRTEKPELHSEP